MSSATSSFERVALRRLFSVVNGATPDSQNPAFWGGDVPWVTPEDLSDRSSVHIADSKRTLTEAGYEACGTTLVDAGAIVLSTRAPIGNVAIAATELCTNQGCKSLVPRLSGFSSRFFAYQLSVLTAELNRMGRGTTFLELSTNELSAFKVSAPPPNLQKRIANFLDEQTARIDALIAGKQRLRIALEEHWYSLLCDTMQVSSCLGQVAPTPGWKVQPLKRLCASIQTGRTPTGTRGDCFEEMGTPWVTPGDLDSIFVERTSKGVSDVALADDEVRLYPPGVTLLVGIGATVGKVAHSSLATSANQQLNILVPAREIVDPVFLTLAVAANREQVQLAAGAATLPIINQEKTGRLRIAAPDVDTQILVRKQLLALRKRTDELRMHVSKHIDRLREYRSSLISAAVTGEIKL